MSSADAAPRHPTMRAPLRAPRRHALACALLCVSLAGCSLLGGGRERASATIYAPDPRVQVDPSWPAAQWQLSLTPPTSARMIDSLRIAVRPTPNELQVYRGAAWSKPPTEMLQDTILRALEDSGKLTAVARQGTGFAADYKLTLDVRRFEADYAAGAIPAATIEVHAKLIHARDQTVVASHTFLHAEPAATTDVGEVVEAFSRGLATVGRETAGWLLICGNRYEQAMPGRSQQVASQQLSPEACLSRTTLEQLPRTPPTSIPPIATPTF